MNERVEQFLSKAKEELQKQEKEKRDSILIQAGLYDKEDYESKTPTSDCHNYDSDRRIYTGKRKVAIDVTDEEYAEICKYITVEEKEQITVDYSNEERLKGTADFLLFLGILATLVLFFTLCFIEVPGQYSFSDPVTKFNPAGLATVIATLLGSIALSSIMKVLANISITLKDIKSKKL